jgi:uncharacterized lipoprotein YehR (DUF1307 family)
MGILKKLFFLFVVIVFTITLSNCSKSNFSHKYQAKSKGSAASIDPVTKKAAPVRKNYIIPGKKKKILGQENPKI